MLHAARKTLPKNSRLPLNFPIMVELPSSILSAHEQERRAQFN